MKQIKVVLADYDDEVRQLMAEELAGTEDIVVAAQTGEADQVLQLVRETEADVLVMEMSLRGGSGLEVLSRVKGELGDRIRVLLCSVFADRTLVNRTVQAGADFYLIKPVPALSLTEHIRLTALDGEGWEEPESLRYRLSMLLRRLGAMPNMKGYHYVIDGVIVVLEDPDAVCGVTKVVYPRIARLHKTNSAAVERSIRHTIRKLWENGDRKELRRIFPNCRSCPSNGAFIAVLAQQMTERQRKWG